MTDTTNTLPDLPGRGEMLSVLNTASTSDGIRRVASCEYRQLANGQVYDVSTPVVAMLAHGLVGHEEAYPDAVLATTAGFAKLAELEATWSHPLSRIVQPPPWPVFIASGVITTGLYGVIFVAGGQLPDWLWSLIFLAGLSIAAILVAPTFAAGYRWHNTRRNQADWTTHG